jgi:hypothetical protein
MRRGQGATEYLVILGAVLLVALVIVSLLGWFPSLGGSTREQQSRSYWAGATPFSITAYLDSNNAINLSIANRGSDRLNLTSVNFTDSVGTSEFNVYTFSLAQGSNPVGGITFNAGEEKMIGNNTAPGSNNQCTGAAAGAVFDYKSVIFTYNQGGITGMKQTGARPLVGRCS